MNTNLPEALSGIVYYVSPAPFQSGVHSVTVFFA